MPDPQGSVNIRGLHAARMKRLRPGEKSALAENGDGNALEHLLDSDGRKALTRLCAASRSGGLRDGHPGAIVDAGLLKRMVFNVPRLFLRG